MANTRRAIVAAVLLAAIAWAPAAASVDPPDQPPEPAAAPGEPAAPAAATPAAPEAAAGGEAAAAAAPEDGAVKKPLKDWENPDCPDDRLMPTVTACAKGQKEFLECVATGQPGVERQCACIDKFDAVSQCIGPCMSVLRETLCPPTDWVSTDSKFLKYTGSVRPMPSVDGAYVISLRRRADRRAKFYANGPFREGQLHLFDGFDGQQLSWSAGLESLFKKNKFNDARGVIGCALSHFALWRHIASTTDQVHAIFEDDAVFSGNFSADWASKYQWAMPADFDLVYFGGVLPANEQHHEGALEPVTRLFAKHKRNTLFSHMYDEGHDVGKKSDPVPAFHYEALGYMLSSKGAEKLVNLVVSAGFVRPVDHMLLKLMRSTDKVYTATPPLVTVPSPQPELVLGRDSDSKKDDTPVPREAA